MYLLFLFHLILILGIWTVKQLTTTVQTQLNKEEQFKISRKTKRDENSVKEEQALQELTKKQEEARHEIDNTRSIERAQLEQEYKV